MLFSFDTSFDRNLYEFYFPEFYFSCFSKMAETQSESVMMLEHSLRCHLSDLGLDSSSLVFIRFFCSDVYTQAPLIRNKWPEDMNCQHIFIGQMPLDSSYISLQAYCINGNIKKSMINSGDLLLQHGGYTSLYTLDLPPAPGSSKEQSDEVISSLMKKLQQEKMTLEGNVLRTWYYIRDVDNNYAGMVKSRVAHYEACGLTPQTHFTASTGIEACAPRPDVLVWLHTYAQQGLVPEQITYLKALGSGLIKYKR